MRKQKYSAPRASKKQLIEIAEIAKTIQKKGLPKYLICKKLSDKLGYGIFLHPDAEPILKGQVIGCYSGEVSLVPQNLDCDGSYAFTPIENIHLTKNEQALYDKKRRFHPRRLYSLMVDAIKKGNFIRFINHSDKPNIIADLLAIPKNPYGLDPTPIEVVYIAKKTIRPGEQLLVSYEDGEQCYWKPLNITPFPMTAKTFRLNASLEIIQST